jgi:photoactive yellow protein
VVRLYNRLEAALAGLAVDDVVAGNFLVEVAPCGNNWLIRERYMSAWERGLELDECIPYTFSYRMSPTKVELRMIVRGDRGWLVVRLL